MLGDKSSSSQQNSPIDQVVSNTDRLIQSIQRIDAEMQKPWWKMSCACEELEDCLEVLALELKDIEDLSTQNRELIFCELDATSRMLAQSAEQSVSQLDAKRKRALLEGLRYGIVGGHHSDHRRLHELLCLINPDLKSPRLTEGTDKPLPDNTFQERYQNLDLIIVMTSYTSHAISTAVNRLVQKNGTPERLLYINREHPLTSQIELILQRLQINAPSPQQALR